MNGNAPANSSDLSENVASALCYLVGFITGIVFLVLEPYNRNRNIKFHAWQSIFLNVGMIALMIGLSILSIILGAISLGILTILMTVVMLVIYLGFFGLWLFLMWKAYNGEKLVLPIIGPLAESQANK
ncbi:MAG: hypothetical protein K2Q23_16175 [Bryobacteraceae bacterium]|nr:hypothetical protein [Bryobacteraceae bacterium]